MTAMIEREIKLRFPSVDAARDAVRRSGATPLRGRRLQEDCLLDTRERTLCDRGSTLRVRIEPGRTLLTFKGPLQASAMKVRSELETEAGDSEVLLRILDELGYRVSFRYQKYREEFARDDAVVAIDETPVGVFVEIEGTERGIAEATAALRRSPDDYLLDSYRSLYLQHCGERGIAAGNMLFTAD
jgi:adenylate cyclase, class 2